MVKIKDIANAAGVSTSTVSRVLANKSNVRDEVKKNGRLRLKKLNLALEAPRVENGVKGSSKPWRIKKEGFDRAMKIF